MEQCFIIPESNAGKSRFDVCTAVRLSYLESCCLRHDYLWTKETLGTEIPSAENVSFLLGVPALMAPGPLFPPI